MEFRYTFTIFTPTYNRADFLPRVYDSLKKQNFKDFEWIIIDDGSIDHTLSIVNQFILEGLMPIRYFYQQNSGKHIAYAFALKEAQGFHFANLDSDDALLPNALEDINAAWLAIDDEQKPNFSAVTGLDIYSDGTLVGTPFPKDVMDISSLDMRYRYKVKGDKWGTNRTQVLRSIVIQQKKDCFVSENTLWDAISMHYKSRFINKKMLIYYQDADLETRLSTKTLKSLEGLLNYYLYAINQHAGRYFLVNPKGVLALFFRSISYAKVLGYSIRYLVSKIKNPWNKALLLFLYPFRFLYLDYFIKN